VLHNQLLGHLHEQSRLLASDCFKDAALCRNGHSRDALLRLNMVNIEGWRTPGRR
jgi:hypothetical protein